MMAIEAARLAGPLAVAGSAALAVYLLFGVKTANNVAISHLAATDKASYWRFGSSLTVLGGLLVIFGVGWLSPTYGLGYTGDILFVLIFVAVFVSAWVPVGRGAFSLWIHRLAGYGLAALMLILVTMLAANQNLSSPSRAVSKLAFIEMAVSWLLVIISVIYRSRKLVPYFLQLELAYAVVAELTLLAVAIWR